MVAKIKTGKSISGAINYHERKVRLGKAELILAQGYLKNAADLSYNDKLQRLADLTRRNERTLVNTLHVSLNFAVSEYLDQELLRQIADAYMEGLGFGSQPYLVYQHYDAAHPHVHIVTTNIKPDGERICFHLLANRTSESARKKVEIDFNLVKAEDRVKLEVPVGEPLEPLDYGKSELKKSITNIVNEVVRSYRFTSIAELNAVLHQYNISAERGAKNSRMYKKNGLVYCAIDDSGKQLGVPIKASSIYGKPTLKNLRNRFRLNEMLRKHLKSRLITEIDKALTTPVSKATFQMSLYESGIQVIFRQNEASRLCGVTFIDHQSKAVFNGSDLGKAYSANILSKGFVRSIGESNKLSTDVGLMPGDSANNANEILADAQAKHQSLLMIDALFKEEQQDLAGIGRLQRKRKKKRKGRLM